MYWPAKSWLILADVHLGKAGHFRKAGIPIPNQVHQDDLGRMQTLIQQFQPQEILILGDLFHSDLNAEWTQFSAWLDNFPNILFRLVIGNHDILPETAYNLPNLTLSEEPYQTSPFCFSHHPQNSNSSYNIAGHLHPGVNLIGKGRQRISLPCFYFGQKQGILPAFGRFTGWVSIKPKMGESIFAITQEKVVAL